MKQIFAITAFLMLGSFAQAHGGHDSHAPMAHLTFANGALHAHATWESAPEVASESILKIEWKNGADHSPVEPPGTFNVVLWMPSMGHGSAPTRIEPLLDAQGTAIVGSYEVSNVYFVMGGDWDVNVTLTYKDGTRETQTIQINFPDDNGGHHGHH